MKKQSNPSRALKSSVKINKSRWAAYTMAGAATALVGARSADGTIIYSGLINQHFDAAPGPLPGSLHTFQLDQPGDYFILQHVRHQPDPAIGSAVFGLVGILSAGFVGLATVVGGKTYAYASKLAFGQHISAGHFLAATASFPGYLAAGHGFPNSQWLNAGTGFIGFKFNGGAGVQYGWARVTMDSGLPDLGHTFTLVDYAFGDPGQQILTGQTSVPESGSSLGLLALGAVGVLALRRKWAVVAN
jgi:hypothetical protein